MVSKFLMMNDKVFFLMYFGHDLSPFINITHLYIEKFDPK